MEKLREEIRKNTVTADRVCILTEQEIQSFQELAKTVMGLELSFDESAVQGSKLIQSMELIMENKKQNIEKSPLTDHNKEENG